MNAYCSKCRTDVSVSWDSPPYSVAHVGDDDCTTPQHVHPVTREPIKPKVDVMSSIVPPWGTSQPPTYRRFKSQKGRSIKKSLRNFVYERACGQCEACGQTLHPDFWECHHRRLRSQGGPNEVTNLVALDAECHTKAHDRRQEWGEPRGLIVPSWVAWVTTPVELWDGRTVFLTLSGYDVLPTATEAS